MQLSGDALEWGPCDANLV